MGDKDKVCLIAPRDCMVEGRAVRAGDKVEFPPRDAEALVLEGWYVCADDAEKEKE